MSIPFGDDELFRIARRDARRDERREAAAEKLEKKRRNERPYVSRATGERRKHLISKVMDALRDWRLTPLENEAEVLYGLRRAMCEQGMKWDVANAEAFDLVSESFRLLGVERPTWDQGQRYYAARQENCSWCLGELDHEDFSRGRRFCSTECAKASLTYRDFEAGYHNSKIGMAAYSIVQRGRNPEIECQQCGYRFRPRYAGSAHANKYCSEKCGYEAKKTLKPIICANPACAKQFQPAHAMKRYCSMKCRDEAPRTLMSHKCEECSNDFQSAALNARFCCRPCKDRFRLKAKIAGQGGVYIAHGARSAQCQCCGQSFETEWAKAKYCSAACRQLVTDMKTGNRIPKRISPPVFDYVFKMAA